MLFVSHEEVDSTFKSFVVLLQVVVLPYLSFVLESNSSQRIPSARGRPSKWRAVIQLAVHNMLPIDFQVQWALAYYKLVNCCCLRGGSIQYMVITGVCMQPGWKITLQTSKYNYTDVYNAKLLKYDARSNKATFQAWRPYLTLSKLENSFIKIMLIVEYSTAIMVSFSCQ